MSKRIPINKLSGDAVDTKPIDCSWPERLGENLDGWTSYEAVECNGCGHEFVAVGLCVLCPKCGGIADQAAGPMMNYFYPVPIQDCEEAAKKIQHLPLCVVQFEDDTTGLALTGGGMDLTWDIVRAYLALGYLPPVHYCRLPNLSGWENYPDAEYVIRACEMSTEVVIRRVTYQAVDLAAMRKSRRRTNLWVKQGLDRNGQQL